MPPKTRLTRKIRKTRRQFLANSAAGTFGFTILPSYLLTGSRSQDGRLPPSKRINLAVIGGTRSPFRIGGALTKTLMLGVICQRLAEELRFDRETERFVGNDRANALLDGPIPRSGWEDFYKMV